jgi:hypothetical protein
MAFKRFQCELCKRRFRTPRGLKVHKKMIHEAEVIVEFVPV